MKVCLLIQVQVQKNVVCNHPDHVIRYFEDSYFRILLNQSGPSFRFPKKQNIFLVLCAVSMVQIVISFSSSSKNSFKKY